MKLITKRKRNENRIQKLKRKNGVHLKTLKSTILRNKKIIKDQISNKLKKIKTSTSIQKTSKRKFMLEIINEYHLSNNIVLFRKKIKSLFKNNKKLLQDSNFDPLTKDYIKSTSSYDFKIKDINIINTTIRDLLNPSKVDLTSKNGSTKGNHELEVVSK